MPRPLPALPGAAEPPERERPNSAASNASHPKEYRMMALQQIRNSLEPFANQQEQLLHYHHLQVGAAGGVPPQGAVGQSQQSHNHQQMKRSEVSSASSTASESSYGYSAFSALPPKTPVRPPVSRIRLKSAYSENTYSNMTHYQIRKSFKTVKIEYF